MLDSPRHSDVVVPVRPYLTSTYGRNPEQQRQCNVERRPACSARSDQQQGHAYLAHAIVVAYIQHDTVIFQDCTARMRRRKSVTEKSDVR